MKSVKGFRRGVNVHLGAAGIFVNGSEPTEAQLKALEDSGYEFEDTKSFEDERQDLADAREERNKKINEENEGRDEDAVARLFHKPGESDYDAIMHANGAEKVRVPQLSVQPLTKADLSLKPGESGYDAVMHENGREKEGVARLEVDPDQKVTSADRDESEAGGDFHDRVEANGREYTGEAANSPKE